MGEKRREGEEGLVYAKSMERNLGEGAAQLKQHKAVEDTVKTDGCLLGV